MRVLDAHHAAREALAPALRDEAQQPSACQACAPPLRPAFGAIAKSNRALLAGRPQRERHGRRRRAPPARRLDAQRARACDGAPRGQLDGDPLLGAWRR